MKHDHPLSRAGRLREPGRCEATGKVGYASKHAAKEAQKARAKVFPDSARQVYLCDCGFWHHSSQPISMRDRDPLRQPLAEPEDLVADPWSSLTFSQVKGAHYALRVMRRSPGTPLEVMDEAILELARVIVQLADAERARRSA